jgi:signal transduction histidine kinase
MKLWHKVFLCTFILFEFLFNASSFYLIAHNFNQNLKKEVDRGLSEQLIVQSQLQSEWTYVSSLNQQIGTTDNSYNFLKNNTHKYTRYFDGSLVFIEILDDQDNTVFSNFSGIFNGNRAELDGLASGDRQYIIRDISDKTYIFISGSMALDNTDYKLSYIRDISDIYSEKTSQVNLFFKMNIAITIVLASGLYALIWFLTRSIRLLNKSAQTIAGGDYTQRVPVLSKDEIGILAQSFNQMAQAVENNIDALELTAKNKQDFINFLTHELKTPLTSIIGYAEFLRTAKYNEEVFFKALTYIYSEGKRLESLSFKLMDLILVSSETPDMTYEDVHAVCDALEEAIKPQLEKYHVGLQTAVEPHMLYMERDLFKLLCTNLLDNAVKASKQGGCIYLRGYMTEDIQYAIEVRDEGIGISEEDIPQIFEPFFVVDKARSKANHGAGLGLAICAEIVRLHEGRIEIKSRLGKGTTVRIAFPKLYN